MGQRRRFTPEFKRHAVQLLNAGQRPAAEIARELGVPRNRLYKWQQEVTAHGGAFPGPGRQAHPAAEIARLKRELARVTGEREILKKTAAYFARESGGGTALFKPTRARTGGVACVAPWAGA